MKAHVVLVKISDNSTVSGMYRGTDRYDIVKQAFQDIVGKPQPDCLDTWKVLEYTPS